MDYVAIVCIVCLLVMLVVVGVTLQKVKDTNKTMQQMFEQEKMHKENEMLNFQQELLKQMVTYQTNISNSLQSDLHQFMQTNANQLNQFKQDTSMQFARFDQRVSTSMLKTVEQTNLSFVSMKEEMTRIKASQEELLKMQGSIRSLQDILNDKKTRGIYGEIELYSLLKQVYGLDETKWMKQVRLSNGSIADCVLFAPEPLGNIVIDSKFPLENYNRLLSSDEAIANKARSAFASDLKKHVNAIADKYLIQQETAEIAYMFVPAESVFAKIYARFQEVVQYAYSRNVYIVSPTTLMAYLTAMKAIYLSIQRNEKAEQIQKEYVKLATEFERFETRYNAVFNDFEKTYKAMQDVRITQNKIMNRFASIVEVNFDQK